MHSMFSLQDKQGIEESSFIVYYLEIRQIAVLLRSCIFFTYFLLWKNLVFLCFKSFHHDYMFLLNRQIAFYYTVFLVFLITFFIYSI